MAATASVIAAKSISKFCLDVEGFGAGASLASRALSVVNLASGLVGVANMAFSLFADSGPAPEQLILDQIFELRQEVTQLRTEMHTRFDQIDASLQEIMETLVVNFDEIDYSLGIVHRDVKEIQASQLELQIQLNRLERYTQERLEAISKQTFLLKVNSCLDYRATTGLEMPFFFYCDCENCFYTWAVNISSDPLWAGPTSRDYSDEAMLPVRSRLFLYYTWPAQKTPRYLALYRLAHSSEYTGP